MLEARNITFSYNDKDSGRILEGISFKIQPGDFIAIVGASGSGKTTLVKHMNGLLKATSGELLYNGQNVYDKSFRISDLRKVVGLVFQYPEHQLFKQTVLEDTMYGPLNLGMTEEAARETAQNALTLVEIEENLWSHSPTELSGGQKRRVAIAGILAMNPRVLVLDEPAAGLDPETKHKMFCTINRIQRDRNLAVVLVSHHMEDVAEYANKVWVMNNGHIEISGAPEEVFARVDELLDINIGIPMITDVTYKLMKSGFPIDRAAVSVDQAEALIIDALERGRSDV